MPISDQVENLQKKAGDVKSSYEQAAKESQDKIRARLDDAKADADKRRKAVKEGADQASQRAQSQWNGIKADMVAKHQAFHERIDRKRDELDVKKAEKDAESAEEYAASALDFADWAMDEAYLSVLDALDARAWADARAAASPS